MKTFEEQKAIWQKYTDEELTNDDIDEINSNLRDFARVLIKLHRELQEQDKVAKMQQKGKFKNEQR